MTSSIPATADHRERNRAVLSSFLGSTVEYYDFLLYAAASGLVFPKLFFSNLSPELGVTLSFVILLIGYIARPVGSMAFGHFGDKFGRKNVLIITLMTMGVVSVAIGLMPSAQKIGVAAPILMVVLRTLQGLAVGGEWAGATLMAMEHSTERNKGFGASLAVAGGRREPCCPPSCWPSSPAWPASSSPIHTAATSWTTGAGACPSCSVPASWSWVCSCAPASRSPPSSRPPAGAGTCTPASHW